MSWHGHYIVAVAGAMGVTLNVIGDVTPHSYSALSDPTTIGLAVGAVVAFVVVRERGLKNEAEIVVLRDEHQEVMRRLERGMSEIRQEIRESLAVPLLTVGKLETEVAVVHQRIASLEHLTQERHS